MIGNPNAVRRVVYDGRPGELLREEGTSSLVQFDDDMTTFVDDATGSTLTRNLGPVWVPTRDVDHQVDEIPTAELETTTDADDER